MILFLFVSVLLFSSVYSQQNATVEAFRNLVQEKINETAPEFETCDDNFMKKAKFADLIEIERRGYYHWAVYIGNGTVIQLNNPDFDKLNVHNVFKNFTGHIELRALKDLAENDSCRVNNKVNEAVRKDLSALPNLDIWKRMKDELKNNVTYYNVITYNCEHFAAKMRFGVPFSSQIEVVKQLVKNAKDKLGEMVAKMFHTATHFLGKKKDSKETLIDVSSIEF